jgi:prepilin-type N-terminal cleavage/methylation domain-containing protein
MISQKGMTLIEVMVSLVVILIVISGASIAYLKLLKAFKTQSKISESYVENLSGRELLRYDIEMAGYGLPCALNSSTYTEAASSESIVPNPNSFNDATAGIPRAFAFSNNGATGANNSDVLVIKSQRVNINSTSKKWSLIYYDGATSKWRVKQWNDASMDLGSNERFIVMDKGRVLQNNAGVWQFSFNTGYFTDVESVIPHLPHPPTPALPTDPIDIYLIYGIDPDTNLQMPFNRADYYLAKPPNDSDFPTRCYNVDNDHHSYILYRSTINQGNGVRNPQPLLDCVMDFQVAFGLDTDGDRNVDTWTDDLNTIVDTDGNGTADEIRQFVRQIAVSILYHEGKKDDDFQFSGSLTLGNLPASGLIPAVPALSTYTPVGDAVNYRWKLMNLTIKPMNFSE